MRVALLGIIGSAFAATPALAQAPAPDAAPAKAQLPPEPDAPLVAPACDAREAEELRTHLAHASRRASKWNLAWQVTFTAASVGSFAVAIADPLPKYTDGLYVSGGKAAIGALARFVLPLRIEVPEPNADTCADLVALRKAVTQAAKRERGLFYTGHIGGLLVNLGGAAIIWYRSGLGQAAISVAVGYPVGLLSNYTMPRGSWQLFRDRQWSAGVVPQQGGGWLVTLGGEL